MFKKKPSIKTLSPLRSSDRRKIADRIISEYGLEAPVKSDLADDKAAAQAAHTSLRNSILPDNALSAKFTTTHGPQLREVSGTVYVGSHGTSEQRVLWIKLEDVLYPSVYTLWSNPGIVPLLHTPQLVVDKIKGGADLMTPGLAGPPFPTKASKGAMVAVACLQHPSVPLIVGTCDIDIASLKDARGAKGKAVEVFHWAGDELWDWSTSGRPGLPPPAELEGWSRPTSDLDQQLDGLEMDDHNLDDGGGGVSLQPHAAQTKASLADTVEVVDSEPDLTTQEIDNAFKQAFLYGVYQQVQQNQTTPKHGFDFPLSQSFVMSNLVLPYLPAHTDKQSEQLNIKKSSWKNIKKFLKALHQDKLLLSKDMKTELIVLDIDFDDHQFTGFRPYALPKRTENTSVAAATVSTTATPKLKVLVLYKLGDKLGEALHSTKPLVTASELKQLVTGYIETENLAVTTNKRLIKLDPFLANTLFNASKSVDSEVLARGQIPRDALTERIVTHSAPFHMILQPDETVDTAKTKPKAGSPPRVGIVLETRGGNKTATRVHGFEAYGVAAQPLADELRKTCAGSTSVEPFKGGKGLEVMVQGPQREAVTKALEKRGVLPGWIDVVDKLKPKKK